METTAVARLREMLSGPASALLVGVMMLGCAFLWVGAPLAWLWIGSQVETSASLGTAVLVMMLGITVTIVGTVLALARVNRVHSELVRRRSGRQAESTALEVILVTSAGLALVLFVVWFFVFAGASPVPLNIGF